MRGKTKGRGRKKSSQYSNLFKTSFVSGAGVFAGIVPQLILGIGIFLLGLALRNKNETSRGGWYYLGYALMVTGSAIGLGFGSSVLLESLDS